MVIMQIRGLQPFMELSMRPGVSLCEVVLSFCFHVRAHGDSTTKILLKYFILRINKDKIQSDLPVQKMALLKLGQNRGTFVFCCHRHL